MNTMLANLPAVERKELVAPERAGDRADRRPRNRARRRRAPSRRRDGGDLGPAALDALASGDQVAAAFLRGVDLVRARARPIARCSSCRSRCSKHPPSPRRASTSAPRWRKAIGIAKPRGCCKARARNWRRWPRSPGWPPPACLRAGDATNAIAALEQANASGDTGVSRTLALAYIAANRGSRRAAASGALSRGQPAGPGHAAVGESTPPTSRMSPRRAPGHSRRRPHAGADVGQDVRLAERRASGARRSLDEVPAGAEVR